MEIPAIGTRFRLVPALPLAVEESDLSPDRTEG